MTVRQFDGSTEQLDRKTLLKLSVKRLSDQAKSIERDIERDCEFIEDKMEILPKYENADAKKRLEQQIAERMIRVDNLRVSLQMIALMQELLEQERKKL